MIRVLCATNECTHLAAQLAAVTAERDELARQLAILRRQLDAAQEGQAFYERLFCDATKAQRSLNVTQKRGQDAL